MIEKAFLKQYATRFQTDLKNILREYFQHLFLSNFYQLKNSQHFFFKGGTALRLVFRSPRFSEDIDFTASCNSHIFDNLFQDVLIAIDKQGIAIEVQESKSTAGGHLAIVGVSLYGHNLTIKIEASQRKKISLSGEKIAVISDIFPSYTVQILEQKILVSEKIDALLTRGKPRDFFDLYFIIRANLGGETIAKYYEELIKKIEASKQNLSELKEFLPHSFRPIVKDLKRNLLNELKRRI